MGGKQHRDDATIWIKFVLKTTKKCFIADIVLLFKGIQWLSALHFYGERSQKKKILTLLKSFRYSHRKLHLWTAVLVLILSLSYSTLPGLCNIADGTWALCQLVFATTGHLHMPWEPTGLALFVLCILNLESMYQAITKFSFSYSALKCGLSDLQLFLWILNLSCTSLGSLLKAGPWRVYKAELMNRYWQLKAK